MDGRVWFIASLLALYFLLAWITMFSIEVLPFMKVRIYEGLYIAYLPPSKGGIIYVLLATAIYHLLGSRLTVSKALKGYLIVISAYFTVNILLDYLYPVDLEFFTFRGLPALNFRYLPIIVLSYTLYIVSLRRIPIYATFTAALLCLAAGIAGWFRDVALIVKEVLVIIPSSILSLASSLRGYEAIISIFVGIPLTILSLYWAGTLLWRFLEDLKERCGK